MTTITLNQLSIVTALSNNGFDRVSAYEIHGVRNSVSYDFFGTITFYVNGVEKVFYEQDGFADFGAVPLSLVVRDENKHKWVLYSTDELIEGYYFDCVAREKIYLAEKALDRILQSMADD